jgi:GT2 family glycosyltransferase
VSGSLSIVIVHYDTPDLLRQCLASLCAEELPCEIVVMDNASPDRSVEKLPEEFPRVLFVFNEENVGFARACNQGIRMGEGAYCMLLNPDAIIDGAASRGLMACMEGHPEVGLVAPRLVYPDGSLQLSVRSFHTLRAILLRILRLDRLFPGPVDRYLMRDWDHAEGRVVDWVMGACMLLRRKAVEEVGLLDEGFFMYYEDIDLCYRMGQQGWKVRYEPGIAVRHEHQRDSASLLPNRLARVHLRSLVRLFSKHQLSWW